MKQFKNDHTAQNAINYMTTSKVYQSDPLSDRKHSTKIKKLTI